MYKESVLSSKYQLVIPRIIRDALGLEQGDRVRYFVRDDQIIIKKAETASEVREDIASYIRSDVKPVENVSQYYRENRFRGVK